MPKTEERDRRRRAAELKLVATREVPAKLVYDAYPDSDLLPISPPRARETLDAYRRRLKAAGEDVGDTLFLFVMLELGLDGMDCAEDRLDQAIADLISVKMAVRRQIFRDHMAARPSKRNATIKPPRRRAR